jgi:hypothetical protein
MRNHTLLVATAVVVVFCSLTACNDSPPPATETEITNSAEPERETKADTVNVPQLVTSNESGTLRLTAEHGKAVGPEIKYMPEWRALGWFTAADKIVWDVKVDQPGDYKVFLEWSVSDEEAGKEFVLETADQKVTGIVDPSGSWETYKIKEVGNIKLKAGGQKIIFRPNKHFDKGAILDFREVKLVPVK